MPPPADYPDHQDLVAALRGFRTRRELEASAAYAASRERLAALLGEPRLFPYPAARPRLADFLRIAHWNIEKGKHLPAAVAAFREHPALRQADLISLNEADVGMNRSGQRFIARELGEALGMHVLFAPAYLEFSKGYGEDLSMPGENTAALQGNAILSRHALGRPRVVALPACFDHFGHAEKRIGGRSAVAAEVRVGARSLTFVSTHLEVRHSPACRARQMGTIVAALGEAPAAVIAGDFNTSTFNRGGGWRTAWAGLRLAVADPERLRRLLARPQAREPLFALLRRHGFTERSLNSDDITCRVPMRGFEDRDRLPAFAADYFERRLRRFNFRLDFRLDWIVGRGVTPLTDGEVVDGTSGVASLGPQTIAGLAVSDHDPITTDIIVHEEHEGARRI